MEEAEADALADLDFPYAHHRRLRTNDVQERANRELKRRSHVVQVFPSRKSLIRMLDAMFSEMGRGLVIQEVVHRGIDRAGGESDGCEGANGNLRRRSRRAHQAHHRCRDCR